MPHDFSPWVYTYNHTWNDITLTDAGKISEKRWEVDLGNQRFHGSWETGSSRWCT